jgi:hypothetical protein
VLNLQIAKADLAGTDNGIATRTWQTGSRGGCFCEQRSGLYSLLALDSASAITGFIDLCSWAQSR